MDTVNVPAKELSSLLKGMQAFIGITKSASKPTFDPSRVEETIQSLCNNGLYPIEKRAELIDGISKDPNRILELLEKIATKAGPSALGASDSDPGMGGGDPESDFVSFCLN